MKQKTLYFAFLMQCLCLHTLAQPGILSQKVIGGSRYDELHSSYATKNGGLIVAGTSYSNKSGEKTQNTRGGRDYWVVKMNKAVKLNGIKRLAATEMISVKP